MSKLLITIPLPAAMGDSIKSLLPAGLEFDMVSSMEEEEFARRAAEADILFVPPIRKVDAKLLSLAPKVRFIQNLGVGYDNIDLKAISAAGVLASNAPGSNAIAVAEHTVLFILALMKHFSEAEHSTRAGQWNNLQLIQAGIIELAQATVGLVGLGAIGRATAERLQGFGPRLLYFARHRADPETEARLKLNYVTLPELLAEANFVSLHLSLNDETYHFMGEKELAQMRPRAFLVNTARGELVDESALRRAIESGHLGGAALDVLVHEAPGGNPFGDLPQVIVTPHIAGFSQATAGRVMQMALANVGRYLKGETPLHLIPGLTTQEKAH